MIEILVLFLGVLQHIIIVQSVHAKNPYIHSVFFRRFIRKKISKIGSLKIADAYSFLVLSLCGGIVVSKRVTEKEIIIFIIRKRIITKTENLKNLMKATPAL